MTPKTLKAARAGLNWSQSDLAREAGIHFKSVANAENMTLEKAYERAKVIDGVIPKMLEAFERHGVTVTAGTVSFQQSANNNP